MDQQAFQDLGREIGEAQEAADERQRDALGFGDVLEGRGLAALRPVNRR